MSTEIKTLLLRFRDLTTAPGETVKTHADIATKKGKVWWGWWSKQNEQVPLDVFSFLLQKMTAAGGVEIYLIDTGQMHVYKAKCTSVKFENSRERLKAPDRTVTPEYYKDQSYLAWFELSNIELTPVPVSDLNSLTYSDVKDFFVDPSAANYSLFENKRVKSLLELRSQDRSIWFVRDAVVSDLDHEILLTGNNTLQPTHFTTDFKNTPNNRLLWFSDIHFGSSHGFLHDMPRKNQKKSLWMAAEEVCDMAGIKNIAGIIVSGDITTHNEQAGFDAAYEMFFSKACSTLTDNNFYNWLICPGNHDFGFSTTTLKDGEELSEPVTVHTENYSAFYNKLFNLQPNKFFCSGRRFLLGNTYPVEIVSLNSLNLQQISKQFQGFGFVGDEQLKVVDEAYGWSTHQHRKRKPIRIAVVHHHLLSVNYTESTTAGARYSITLDAEAITRWMLEHEITLVLHGHMHQPTVTQIKRPIVMDSADENMSTWHAFTVCGLGSSGVKSELLGEVGKNMFGVLTFDDDQIQIEFYELKSNVRPASPLLPLYKICVPI